jgi:hypothetical protein
MIYVLLNGSFRFAYQGSLEDNMKAKAEQERRDAQQKAQWLSGTYTKLPVATSFALEHQFGKDPYRPPAPVRGADPGKIHN